MHHHWNMDFFWYECYTMCLYDSKHGLYMKILYIPKCLIKQKWLLLGVLRNSFSSWMCSSCWGINVVRFNGLLCPLCGKGVDPVDVNVKHLMKTNKTQNKAILQVMLNNEVEINESEINKTSYLKTYFSIFTS